MLYPDIIMTHLSEKRALLLAILMVVNQLSFSQCIALEVADIDHDAGGSRHDEKIQIDLRQFF